MARGKSVHYPVNPNQLSLLICPCCGASVETLEDILDDVLPELVVGHRVRCTYEKCEAVFTFYYGKPRLECEEKATPKGSYRDRFYM